MAYSYTSRDGERVEVNVAAAFDRLAAAFRNAHGLTLHVSSGTRTTQDQINIFLSRYVTAGAVGGRYVYDTRVWNGTRYYRVSSAGTVAVPGTSNHEENGPNGPRSIDIRDSGSNAGVTSRGSARDIWMANNAGAYGFENEGYNFGEPWHKTFRGSIGGGGGGGSVSQDTKNRQEWLNRSRGENLAVDGQQGPATTEAYKRYQTFLRGYGYTGDIDGDWGAGTQAAHQRFYDQFTSGKLAVDGELGPATVRKLQAVLGVAQDGDWGPATTTALQKKLVAVGHNIAVDGDLGPATIKALQTYILGASKADGQIGPETIRGLQNYLNSGGTFPAKSTPTPTTPPKLVVDGEWGVETTNALQRALGVTVDGELGPETYRALQKALGVTVDGEIGPETRRALQTAIGATVDGQTGPETVRKLQEFLNAGKKFTPVKLPDPDPVVTYPKPAQPTYPGATWWNHSPNSSPRRDGDKVQYFVVHHAADTNSVETQRDRFMRANDRNVSPNWLIGKDGSVSEIVPPDKYRAWTTGQFDYNAVTVETQNTSGNPNWGISEESHVAIAKLVAWASKRYGFPIDRQHVLGHREVPNVPATACPGPSMNLDKIVTLAQEYAKPAEPVDPKPSEPETPTQPTPTMWKIEIPRDEAEAAGKAIDEAIGVLTQLKKLLP